ncbi:Fe(2+) transporter permease subunit FeoB [Vibrio sp. S11_S32]|uniref:Fe(2+) transporter permease subunit FeoB n=1 Tax=Vibrio sp. S11_S32 TaxID=2720225 RepID=UPI00168078A7|nr:Fe(2+) transporter permease subunit FeoB [Vibrio sp. S11_S32]MBD1575553.1 Fe(2+) transporter permease subunit FeoB [Vibrio sp. S11_S32]
MNFNILTVGNPNSGKTTLFNGLTGAKQQVGNWAGVTVEKKTGSFEFNDESFSLTDLPGIYSLNSANDANSVDESIASSAISSMPADLIINVVDATSLERSLYMTLQLRELGRPMIVVLNKLDALHRERQEIDVKALQQELGCPVFILSAINKKQVAQFKADLHKIAHQNLQVDGLVLHYPGNIEAAIEQINPLWPQDGILLPRALSIRAIEQDGLVTKTLSDRDQAVLEALTQQLSATTDIDLAVTNSKFEYLHQLCHQVRQLDSSFSKSFTEKLDQFVLNKWFGIPVFFAIMYLMFMFSINIGSAFIDFFDIGVGALLVDGGHHLLDPHLPVWLVTVIADGFGGGIQTVATFIPVIACLYLFLTLLESSGYMARAAFVLDKVMQKIGLPGKAFVPLILGFGCNVPAIMATRTLDQERERKLSAAMAPFMSCGARLPVYTLFAAAFFPTNGQNVVFALYLLGILAAVFTGLVLKHTLYPGKSTSFIMEIPDYEIPTLRNVVLKTWQKLKRFVFGAGKTIVLVVAVLSFFNSWGVDGSFGNQDSQNSVLSHAAKVVTPVLSPMGVEKDNWPATVGIITGIFAKEAVVGTLNNLYSDPSDEEEEFNLTASLMAALQSIPDNLAALNFSDPLGIEVGDLGDKDAAAADQGVSSGVFGNIQAYFVTGGAAFAYLVFILLYTPCAAAMGAYAREFGRNYAIFIASWTMFLAYASAVVVYQISSFEMHPMMSSIWLAIITVILLAVFFTMKRIGAKEQSMRIDIVNIS